MALYKFCIITGDGQLHHTICGSCCRHLGYFLSRMDKSVAAVYS